MDIYEGRTFTMPHIDGAIPHLFFVLNHPDENNEFIIVNITSCVDAKSDDTTLILVKGDHSYVNHNSFVFYAKAVKTNTETLLAAYNAITKSQTHEDADEDLITDILCGFFDSPYSDPQLKKYLESYIDYDEDCVCEESISDEEE